MKRLLPFALLAGCDVRFGAPERLPLLVLVPFVALFLLWSLRRRGRLAERLVSAALAPRLLMGVSRPRRLLKAGLVCGALAFIVLALADPQYGYRWEEVKRRGIDLVIALDVSDSMLVADGPGGATRLELAKRELSDLLDMLDGDRVGIVAFSGGAFLECPLTLDYGAARQYLDELTPDVIAEKGTALGTAIRTSLAAFERSTGEARAMLLITDGEDTSGQARAAALEAKKQGVRIYAVGIGRDEGAPIPNADGGFRRDRAGTLVLSRLDEPALQQIALTTGGAYVRSVTGDVDLESIYKKGIKATIDARDLGESRRQHWQHRFQWLLGLALALLAIEALLPERPWRAHVA